MRIHNICGFVHFRRSLKVSFTRLPDIGDGWSRFIAGLGPVLLSWSWSDGTP